MVRGLYTSATGMTVQMNRMDIISNNLANADTTGYKKDIVSTASFPEELASRMHDRESMEIFNNPKRIGNMTMGAMIQTVHTDFTQGNLKPTNGTFDLAINGDGFFAVDVNGTEQYTRDGGLMLNNQRQLVTYDNFAIKGQNGNAITVPDGSTTIDKQGNIFVNEEYIDTIKLVSFEDPQRLSKTSNNLLTAPANMTPGAFTGSVNQGYKETSNVNVVREMVEMITISRAYEANSKMIQSHDTIMTRAASDIGKK